MLEARAFNDSAERAESPAKAVGEGEGHMDKFEKLWKAISEFQDDIGKDRYVDEMKAIQMAFREAKLSLDPYDEEEKDTETLVISANILRNYPLEFQAGTKSVTLTKLVKDLVESIPDMYGREIFQQTERFERELIECLALVRESLRKISAL